MRMRIVSKVSLTAVLFLLAGVVPAQAATPSLSGKVVDLANKSIVGVKVNLMQSGRTLSTVTTGADGGYSFNVASGAYSLNLVPPTAGYSTLNAYDIALPAPQPITFMLTPPTPGRAFLTGHVTTPPGFDLDLNNTGVFFGNTSSALQDSSGYFKLMPTAGVTSTFAITGRLSAESFYFTMTGKDGHQSGLSSKELAEVHSRSEGAIQSRLKKIREGDVNLDSSKSGGNTTVVSALPSKRFGLPTKSTREAVSEKSQDPHPSEYGNLTIRPTGQPEAILPGNEKCPSCGMIVTGNRMTCPCS